MLKILIGILPEIIKIICVAYKRYKDGADSSKLREEVKALRELLSTEDRALAARKLSSAWASDADIKL